MKSKVCILCFILIFLGVIFGIKLLKKDEDVHSDIYLEYQYPNEEFFGEELYSEIDYKSSPDEIECGNDIIDKINQIASYTGKESEALDEGALNIFYCYDYPSAVKQELQVEFITCKLSQYEGHLWIVYDQEIYDEDGNVISRSSSILTLISLEKSTDGKWITKETKEAP